MVVIPIRVSKLLSLFQQRRASYSPPTLASPNQTELSPSLPHPHTSSLPNPHSHTSCSPTPPTTILAKTLSFREAFSGPKSLWLIVISFFFARGFGGSDLFCEMVWGLTIGETLVAPAMQSTVSRAGGVFLPIIGSTLFLSGGEEEEAWAVFDSIAIAANNLLCLKLAEELGVKIASPWITWFKAASLPAILSL